MRTIYDIIDPRDYEERHKRSPREAYLYHHWRPIICKVVRLLYKAMQKHSITVEALDVGCGAGVYTEEISKSSQICVGLDLSENMIRYAKKRQEGLNLVLADAHNLPFRDECFNLVVSVGLLEYVQRDVVLKEIARTIKKRTFLMVVTPNKYSAFRLPIKFFSKVSKRDYTAKEFSFKEMLQS